jgi:hypothetical protein
MTGLEGFGILILIAIWAAFFRAGFLGARDEYRKGKTGTATLITALNVALFGLPILFFIVVGFEAILGSLLLAALVGGFILLAKKFA